MFEKNDKVMVVLPKGKNLNTVKIGIDLLEPMKAFLKRKEFKPLTVSYISGNAVILRECHTQFGFDKALFKKVEPLNNRAKKGDKVMFTIPQGKSFTTYTSADFNCGLIQDMLRIVKANNGVLTVRRVDENYDGKILYFEEDGQQYAWDIKWFMKIVEEPVVESTKVEFTCNKTKGSICALLKDVDGKFHVGRATKHPDDEYDKAIGMIISLAKALKVPKERVSQIADVLTDDVAIRDIGEIPYSEIFYDLRQRALEEESRSPYKI